MAVTDKPVVAFGKNIAPGAYMDVAGTLIADGESCIVTIIGSTQKFDVYYYDGTDEIQVDTKVTFGSRRLEGYPCTYANRIRIKNTGTVNATIILAGICTQGAG